MFTCSPNTDGFYTFYISQGSVATQLRCGGMFGNKCFTACTSEKVWKSVNIWQRYGKKLCGLPFLGGHPAYVLVQCKPIRRIIHSSLHQNNISERHQQVISCAIVVGTLKCWRIKTKTDKHDLATPNEPKRERRRVDSDCIGPADSQVSHRPRPDPTQPVKTRITIRQSTSPRHTVASHSGQKQQQSTTGTSDITRSRSTDNWQTVPCWNARSSS